jgi:hypothetical protein
MDIPTSSANILYVFVIFLTNATCLTHLIRLDLISLRVYDEA